MQCRKGEGYQIRESYEFFKAILLEAGIDTEGLRIEGVSGDKQWVWYGDVLLGAYHYSSGRFRAQNGCIFDYKFDILIKPDKSKKKMDFSEFMDLIIE